MFCKDIVEHQVQDCNIGARANGQMIGCVSRKLSAARINDDGGFTFHCKLLELRTCNRMGIGRVGSDYKYAVGVLQVFNGICGCACSESPLHAQGSG